MPTAICIPVLEVDGWEEAQAPFVVKEPRRIYSRLIYCPHCGKPWAWWHVYLKEGNGEPYRAGYLSHAMVCENCNGAASFRNLHIYFWTDQWIVTGNRAVKRELRLLMGDEE